jgi:tRNA threonylcarbamoyladenosine biosynthesis protein TsaB
MIILGIETSTNVCSVGLADETGSLGEKSLIESHIHSEKLLTLTQLLCLDLRTNLSQIDGIAISIGPGSFTGLRIGLSSAQGLRYALGKPLVAIPSLYGIAVAGFLNHRASDRITVLIDAKQGEFYAGYYKRTGSMVETMTPVHIIKLSEIEPEKMNHTMICTDRAEDVGKSMLRHARIEDVHVYCRGDVIATLAVEQIDKGSNNSGFDIEPAYLKDFIVRPRI